MDVNDFRTVFSVACLAIFAGIVYWAYSKRNRSRFDDAANLPFADDDIDGVSQSGVNNG